MYDYVLNLEDWSLGYAWGCSVHCKT